MFERVAIDHLKHPEMATILPKRHTKNSAGYDIRVKEDIEIKPHEMVTTMTDIKCKMPDDHFLMVVIRSSLASKYGLGLRNQLGIIDADYYGNSDNDGNIGLVLENRGKETIYLKEQERVAQGILMPYGIFGHDEAESMRDGGFGSTGRE